MSEPDATFSKMIGWVGTGGRLGRYAIVVDHGKVVYAAQEEKPGSVLVSDADAVLAHL